MKCNICNNDMFFYQDSKHPTEDHFYCRNDSCYNTTIYCDLDFIHLFFIKNDKIFFIKYYDRKDLIIKSQEISNIYKENCSMVNKYNSFYDFEYKIDINFDTIYEDFEKVLKTIIKLKSFM